MWGHNNARVDLLTVLAKHACGPIMGASLAIFLDLGAADTAEKRGSVPHPHPCGIDLVCKFG
jgi:hypothetical protein